MDDPKLLESLLQEPTQATFVEINWAVVDKPPQRRCQLRKMWELFSRKAQCSQALRYSNLRGDPALLAQRSNNLFAAQAIGNVLECKIYSGILPRVVDG